MLATHPLLLHPVILVILQIFIIALAIGLTSPNTITRLAGLPLVAVAAWLVVMTCSDYLPRAWVTVVAGNGPTYFLRYIELVLLCKWSFDTGRPITSRGNTREPTVSKGEAWKTGTSRGKLTRTGTSWERLRFGLRLVVSPRMVDTPYEVRNVPHFTSQSNEVPSRGQFLRQNAGAIIISYIVVDLSTLGARPDQNETLFAERTVPLLTRLGDVTVEELVIRTMSTLMLCVNVVCFMHISYGIMAFTAVALGLSDVRSWRPPFGSPEEAYTLRRFWGVFWHQMLTPTFFIPANFLTYGILRLPRSSRTGRLSRVFLTFFISAILHTSVDLAGGMTWQESGSLRFFCTQALGIIVESCVEDIVHVFTIQEVQESGPRTVGSWARMFGYVWTVTFMVWSTPAYSYPAIRRAEGGASGVPLPFSIVRILMRGLRLC